MQAMLIIVVGILFLVALLAFLVTKNTEFDNICDFAGIVLFITSLFLVFCLIGWGVTSLDADVRRENMETQYQSILYQIENEECWDDFEGKHKLYNEIIGWNNRLASGKKNQRNLWTGFTIPDIYDDFEFIEFPE